VLKKLSKEKKSAQEIAQTMNRKAKDVEHVFELYKLVDKPVGTPLKRARKEMETKEVNAEPKAKKARLDDPRSPKAVSESDGSQNKGKGKATTALPAVAAKATPAKKAAPPSSDSSEDSSSSSSSSGSDT